MSGSIERLAAAPIPLADADVEWSRVDALTGVRALAAGWVLVYHVWLLSGREALTIGAFGATIDFTPIVSMGWFGVDVFFILSGFVLTWQVLHQPPTTETFGAAYAKFIRRRILRVYPAYYACLAVLLVLAWLHVYGTPPGIWDLGLHLVMFHNVVDAYVTSINGVFWSLPFEWQFYLIFPFLVPFLLRGKTLTLLCLGLGASVATKLIVLAGGPTAHSPLLAQLPMRLDAFVVGMVAAQIASQLRSGSRWQVCAFWAGGLGLILAAQYFGIKQILWWSWDATPFLRAAWVDCAVALLLIGLSGRSHFGARLFNNAPMVWLGTISYSVYLWHLPIVDLVTQTLVGMGGTSFAAEIAICVPLTVAASAASYYLVERPFVNMGKRSARTPH